MMATGRSWTPEPPSVEVSASSRKSLRMSWVQGEGMPAITKYMVKVKALKHQPHKFTCPVKKVAHHHDQDVRHCELSGLSPLTQYNLTVRACTSKACSPPTFLLASTAGPAMHPFLIALIVICVLLLVVCFAVNYDVMQALCCPSYDSNQSVEYHSTGSSTPPSTTTTVNTLTTTTIPATTTTNHHAGRQQHQPRPMEPTNALTSLVKDSRASPYSSASPPARVPTGGALSRSASVEDRAVIHPCVKTSLSSPLHVSPVGYISCDPPDYDTVILQADVYKEHHSTSSRGGDPHMQGRI